MIPSRRLVLWALIPVLPAIAFVVEPAVWPALIGLDVVWLAVAAGDALAARQGTWAPTVVRAVRERQLVARPFEVSLTVDGVRGWVEVTDDVPAPAEASPTWVAVGPDGAVVTRTLRYDARGRYRFGPVTLRVDSPLGLWIRQLRVPAGGQDEVRVGPDVTPLRGKALLGRRNTQRASTRVRRQAGGESEFERLRPYVSGDPMRHIDWKATARHRRLVVRQFGQEVGQNVVFMLDGGRLMTQRLGDRMAFDVALDASLVLAWTALRHGDRVGMMVADRTVRAWVPPRGGPGHANRIVRTVGELHPTLEEADPGAALGWLSSRLRRRSLVVWVTRVMDDVAEQRARAVVRAMAGRHLPLCVWLRDPRLDERLLAPAEDRDARDTAWVRAASADLAVRRAEALEGLRRMGALVVDTTPDQLGDALRDRYLEVKARHLL